MSKQLQFVHSYRLTEADEQKLTWLIQALQINPTWAKSTVFRVLIRRMYARLQAEEQGKKQEHELDEDGERAQYYGVTGGHTQAPRLRAGVAVRSHGMRLKSFVRAEAESAP